MTTARDAFDHDWWDSTWHKRAEAFRKAFGQEVPAGQVQSFQFKDPVHTVPGACVLQFGTPWPQLSLYATMGLTQPVTHAAPKSGWEFALYAAPGGDWVGEVLFDLTTGWAEDRDWLREGHQLPLTFFRNAEGDLDAGVVEAQPPLDPVGLIRGLYLWRDITQPRKIKGPTGEFFLMAACGVTRSEMDLADETTPPHLLLLLRELGIGQVTDPARTSATEHKEFHRVWKVIRKLPHDKVVEMLNRQAPPRPRD
jgi:hypothetical protein